MIKKIFIGNCDYNVDEEILKTFIEEQGVQVSNVKIILDRNTGRSRGFGFAELAGSETLEHAIEVLNGKEIEGRAITVNEAREQAPRGGGNRGGFGGGRGPGGGGGGRGGRHGQGRGRGPGGGGGPRW